jgi:hypothetical protein
MRPAIGIVISICFKYKQRSCRFAGQLLLYEFIKPVKVPKAVISLFDRWRIRNAQLISQNRSASCEMSALCATSDSFATCVTDWPQFAINRRYFAARSN